MTEKQHSDLYDAIALVHDYNIDPTKFQIYLVGEEDMEHEETMEFGEPGVEYRMANRAIRNLNLLSSMDKKRAILIHMKTCGGHVFEGHAIYDAIMAIPNPVTIINYTHARSMSSIIFQAANKRIMMPSSYFMFHEGDTAVAGTPKQVESIVNFDKHYKDMMLKIYADRMKQSPDSKVRTWSSKRIKEWLQREMDRKEDVHLTAQEAVEWGFADEVFSGYDSVFTYTKQQRNIK